MSSQPGALGMSLFTLTKLAQVRSNFLALPYTWGTMHVGWGYDSACAGLNCSHSACLRSLS